MSRLRAEPQGIASMQELLATAAALEQEAVAGYRALAARMRAEGRADLALVFDALVEEETRHLGQVDEWSSGVLPDGPAAAPHDPLDAQEPAVTLFDDEEAGLVAPEMLTSYRAFSMAVRNEERAFVFWTYVAAHAPDTEIRQAAERMANEELGHVATLRRERRRAFHAARSDGALDERDLPWLERRLAALMETAIAAGAADRPTLASLAEQARARAEAIAAAPFQEPASSRMVSAPVLKRAVPLCELLLDRYLDRADREKGEAMRARAQAFAAELLHALPVLRALAAA